MGLPGQEGGGGVTDVLYGGMYPSQNGVLVPEITICRCEPIGTPAFHIRQESVGLLGWHHDW
jgi:hypothetical protein